MAFYAVGGKLGSGKSLVCVGVIRDAMRAGKRVATNLDLFLDKMLPRESRLTALRLPDKPTVADLNFIGRGQEGIEETENGVLVLDECASWLNARTWNDPEREGVLDWFRNSRKHGWDVYLITQHMDLIDKQVRTSVIEFSVRCARLDRLGIPFISTILKIISFGLIRVRMPKIHMATVRYGVERESLVVDRLMYRARDLYECYDTRQVFKDDHMIPVKGQTAGVLMPHVGIYTYLSAWHTLGRVTPRKTLAGLLRALWNPPARPKPRFVADCWSPILLRMSPDARWRIARNLNSSGYQLHESKRGLSGGNPSPC